MHRSSAWSTSTGSTAAGREKIRASKLEAFPEKIGQKIPEENFIKDASDYLKRFRFRKIGKLIRENLNTLKTMDASGNEASYMYHLKLHLRLKEAQASLAKETGTVVVG